MKALVVGGRGGIGAALAVALAERTGPASVVATWGREPPLWEHPGVQWLQLDPCSDGAVAELAEGLGEIDVLINAVGLLHDAEHGPERTIRQLAPEHFRRSIEINTLPTLLLAKHCSRNLRHQRRSVFATVSARVGSIADNHLGGWYSYRASKAALNMALKTLSIEWQRLVPNGCVASLHPGTVDTALSRPFQRNVKAGSLFSPERSASCMVDIIERVGPADSGKFWSWDGAELPW